MKNILRPSPKVAETIYFQAIKAGMLYRLVCTCRRENFNPYELLKNVLEKIRDYSINKHADLLPKNYK